MTIAYRIGIVFCALLVGMAFGWRTGVQLTMADWRAADLARETAQREARDETLRVAGLASARHEAERARIARNLTEARHALRNALSAPISCLPEASVPLGDLVLPAAALLGVRDAGAGSAEPGSAAGESGAAVRPGPTDPDR